jgi:plastocyanin
MHIVSKRLYCVAALAIGALLHPSLSGADAGRFVIDVSDRDGLPVPEVAVYALPVETAAAQAAALPPHAVMDQNDRAFVPHILVAQTGTAIDFPNSDSVSHHVYSFSPAKSFELALYKQGAVHPPLVFDVPGVVTLGCNIHDNMVGYILVVDTPYFAITDGNGEGVLDGLPPGRYRLQVWTPRLRPGDLPDPMEATVGVGETATLGTRLDAKLLPAHGAGHSSLTWSHY